MDLNQAMQFIRWDEQRRSSGGAGERRAEETLALSKQRFAFDYGKELRRMREKEVEHDKYVISSFTQAYEKTSSAAVRNTLRESMSTYYNSLSPSVRPALKPYIDRSPLSDMQMKANEFDRVNKPVPPPTEEDYENNKQKVAQYVFAAKDREYNKQKFLTGYATEVPSLIMIDKDFGAYRGENGVAQFLSNDDLKLHLASAKSDISLSKLYANGGKIREENPVSYISQGGSQMAVHLERDIIADTTKAVTKRIGAAPKTTVPIPSDIRTLLDDIAMFNEDNETATAYREMIYQGPNERAFVLRQLESKTNHLSFRFDKVTELSWLDREFWIPFFNMPFVLFQSDVAGVLEKKKRRAEGYGLKLIQGDMTPIDIPDYGMREFFITPDGTIRNIDNTVVGHTNEGPAFVNRIKAEFDKEKGEK